MSKTAKPKGTQAGQAGDIHARIAFEAASLRNLSLAHIQDASATPALSAMLDSARTALDQSIPKSFEHMGRAYWLQVTLPVVRMTIFDTPTTREPMAVALSGSEEKFGHTPGH